MRSGWCGRCAGDLWLPPRPYWLCWLLGRGPFGSGHGHAFRRRQARLRATLLERLSSRPDFLVLGYPWLNAMQPSGHYITYCSVIKTIPPATCKLDEQKYTPSLHVTSQTPTTFIYSTSDDRTVPISASVDFYNALIAAGVPGRDAYFPPWRSRQRYGSGGRSAGSVAGPAGAMAARSGSAYPGSQTVAVTRISRFDELKELRSFRRYARAQPAKTR